MDWLVWLVEGLFLILFVATLRRYITLRDPVSRDLALVFSALAVLFVAEAWELTTGERAGLVSTIGAVLLLLQPVFTLHLVSLVRPVPNGLIRGAAIILIALMVPALALPAPPATFGLKTVATVVAVAAFIAFEAAAAIYLLFEAIRREGPVAIRIGLAAISTGIFATALFAAVVAPVASAPAELSRIAGAGLALLAGVGYVFAFLTPGPIRRIWQASTTVDYTRGLIARSSAPVSEIWLGFVEATVRMQGGSAVLITGIRPGNVTIVASTVPTARGIEITWDGVDTLVEAGRSRWDIPAEDLGSLGRAFAEATECRFLSVVPIDVPQREGTAVLVLLSTHRALFHASDVVLLSALGAQTAIVAEHQTVVAEQRALADRLATTVEALRSASAAKSDFVASMSHEFRTPLSAIIGFSDLMTTEPRDGDKVTVPIEWVDHIQRGGQHLLTLVNDVLDLARVEAGRLELRREAVDLGLAVTEAVNGLRPLADRKNLELRVDAPSIEVTVDRGRFRQIIYNLVSNAIKYTHDGGSIRVTVSRVADEIRIAVGDSGVGIAPEDHGRVFEEFRQVGDPAERQPGSGLGLAVTKRLAEAHDGHIELISARGQGSTFTLVLPAGDVAPAPVDADGPQSVGSESTASPETSHGDILVIEDDPSAVRLLREYLEGAGFGVRVTSSGEMGIAAALAQRPAAIVLDVLLPGVDGWEVLRRLKADERLQDVPVVIVTVVEEREVGLALGAVDYLIKPINREALLGCLARFVSADDASGVAKRVLVVDDETAALTLISRALEPEGVVVVTAKGGREALDWAEHGQLVDLVICDLVMPDVDGFAVISALKQNPRTAALPIVVCTAHDLSFEQKERLNGKILGIVAKGQDARAGLLDWLDHAIPVASH